MILIPEFSGAICPPRFASHPYSSGDIEKMKHFFAGNKVSVLGGKRELDVAEWERILGHDGIIDGQAFIEIRWEWERRVVMAAREHDQNAFSDYPPDGYSRDYVNEEGRIVDDPSRIRPECEGGPEMDKESPAEKAWRQSYMAKIHQYTHLLQEMDPDFSEYERYRKDGTEHPYGADRVGQAKYAIVDRIAGFPPVPYARVGWSLARTWERIGTLGQNGYVNTSEYNGDRNLRVLAPIGPARSRYGFLPPTCCTKIEADQVKRVEH